MTDSRLGLAAALERAAREFAEATALPPYLFDLGPAEGRAVMDEIQGRPVAKPAVDIRDMVVPGGPSGEVAVRILRPGHASGTLPAVVYVHGADWVFGNRHTHDRLIREIAVGARAAVVFPDYTPSPEAKYPTAIEECYAVASWVAGHGGTLAAEYVLLTGAVPPAAAGGATGLACAMDGVSGAVANAVTTALLASALVPAGVTTLPAAVSYSRVWLCGAAVAAVGAVVVAAGVYAAHARTRRQTVRQAIQVGDVAHP